MRKAYEIQRAAKEELNAQMIKHGHFKLKYRYNSRELAAFIKGCNYIIFRLRKGTLEPNLFIDKPINTKTAYD